MSTPFSNIIDKALVVIEGYIGDDHKGLVSVQKQLLKDELNELLQSIQDKESKSIKIKKSLLVKGALLALGLYIF